MAKQKQIHVIPGKDPGEQVKSAGAKKAYRTAETKAEATKIARDVAKNQEAELYIHGLDHKIQSRDSYGNDPHPPKG